jgi:thioredoxin 1
MKGRMHMVMSDKWGLAILHGAHRYLWILLVLVVCVAICGAAGCSKDNSNAVVAEVNGQRITIKHVQDQMANLPEELRDVYEQEPEGILNQLIVMALLMQESRRRGLINVDDLHYLNDPQVQAGIRRLLEMEIQSVDTVTDQEVTEFYQSHQSQMGGKSLSELKEHIHGIILANKQQQEINEFVGRLHANAAIITYPERLPKPSTPTLAASTAEEFHRALGSGRPTVVDFGSNRCIPCIRLRPVLHALKDAHGDRINVIFMEINDNGDLARQYRVQLIPTLIFFDADGREVHRKMGFMDRKSMEKVLHDLGFLG